jgi:hypothetical protein
MARRAFLALPLLVTAGCAHDPNMGSRADAEVVLERMTCAAGTLVVSFDPALHAIVRRDGDEIAFASFRERRAESPSCESTSSETLAPLGYDDSQLAVGTYRRVELECRPTQPVEIVVHAIFDGDHPGKIVGSALVLATGTRAKKVTILSAVVKNQGDPQASRVYRAPSSCRRF